MDRQIQLVLDRLYAEDTEQRAAKLPRAERTRNVDRDTGEWLRLLVMSMRARSVLEMGSSNAVSTIWFASGVQGHGGKVTGTEIIPERAAAANRNLAEAGLASVATVLAGPAAQSLANLPGPFDVVFIDAEKDDYSAHLLTVIDRIPLRGLILADNVISHDISAYQQLVRSRDDLETTTLPIGRGIEFTVKIGE